MENLEKIKLLILDVDGVLTDGTKVYDETHKVLTKSFMCKDFTAIKRIIASGIKVVVVSGDFFNKTMAEKRNLEFHCTRDSNLSLDKSKYVEYFSDKFHIPNENISFVGDDYFDLSIFKKLKYTFCPSDSPKIIKDNAFKVLSNRGGQGVIVELYDFLIENQFIEEALASDVENLDRLEITSTEMKLTNNYE